MHVHVGGKDNEHFSNMYVDKTCQRPKLKETLQDLPVTLK